MRRPSRPYPASYACYSVLAWIIDGAPSLDCRPVIHPILPMPLAWLPAFLSSRLNPSPASLQTCLVLCSGARTVMSGYLSPCPASSCSLVWPWSHACLPRVTPFSALASTLPTFFLVSPAQSSMAVGHCHSVHRSSHITLQTSRFFPLLCPPTPTSQTLLLPVHLHVAPGSPKSSPSPSPLRVLRPPPSFIFSHLPRPHTLLGL